MTRKASSVETSETSLTIDRVFATTPERLFQAWTDPDLVRQWLMPGPMRCNVPIYEPRKGGRFRIEMAGEGPNGEAVRYAYEGTFDEVIPGQRIVMLWPPASPSDDASASDPPSVVTATFTPVAGGTRLRLTQDALPNKEGAGYAAAGWSAAFEMLAGLVER